MQSSLALLLAAAALGAAGCGYEPVYAAAAPEQSLALAALPGRVPRVELTQTALQGARAELAAAGVLRPSGGYPRMLLELLRVDELSSGIAARARGDGEELPLARGMALGVVGRAWVLTSADAEPLRDTGDVRRVESVAAQASPLLDAVARDDAAHAAARQLGQALARRVLGEARVDVEEM
jgi:hypothetical protein